jgi:hypothetical protein
MQTLHHTDESHQTAQNIILCRSVRTALEEQYENWKTSSFMERSMMRKDFAKYTDMSIDDMVSTLKKLEVSLQKRAPIMEFLEPLRKLAAYQRKVQSDSKQATIGHRRLTDAEMLVNMIVNEAQRMLLDRITARDHAYGQVRTAGDEDTSGFPVLDYFKNSPRERRTVADEDTSDFPVLDYFAENSRESRAPLRPLAQSPTVSFSCVWSDEVQPRLKYVQTV